MSGSSQGMSLGEAVSRFLISLSPEEREISQQEVYRFARWYGWGRLFANLTASDIARYTGQLSPSDTDYAKKLDLIRGFLAFGKKEGWSKSNLAIHVKTKKGQTPPRPMPKRARSEAVVLTEQGYTELHAELAALKDKRHEAIEEMRKAAEDKDFRENAPLEAAREQHGQLEGRIRELEETLKSATVINDSRRGIFKVGIGDSVILHDLATNEELRYRLVSPREVDLARGKISSASPIGKAIIGRGQGEVVEVIAPAGRLRYQIKQIIR